MYCFLHPKDYGSRVGDTNKEEEEDDEEKEEGEDNEEEQEEEEEEDNEDEIEESTKIEEGAPCPGNDVSSNSGLQLLVSV